MRTLAIILACVVGPALIPIGIVVVMERRAEPLVHPPALVWGDRVFVSKAQFASWLEERGASYQEWVGRHPGASPWERRAALAAGPTKPAATGGKAASADRRAREEPSVGERLGSALGRARSALVPALVAALGGLILGLLAHSRRRIGGSAAWRASRPRLHGAVGTFGGLALLAAKARALPGRLWAGPRAGGLRLAGAGAQPAMAAGGVHHLSLAVEPAPAVRERSTGGSGGGRRRRGPRRTFDPRVQPVEPEPEPEPAASAAAVDKAPEAADFELAPEASPVDAEHALEAPVSAAAGVSEPVRATPVVEHVLEPVEAERAAKGAAAASVGPIPERVEPVAPEPPRAQGRVPAAQVVKPVAAEHAPVAAADAAVSREEPAVDAEPAPEAPVAAAAGGFEPVRATPAIAVEHVLEPVGPQCATDGAAAASVGPTPERVEPELAAAEPAAAVPSAVVGVERAPERVEPEPNRAADAPRTPVAPEPVPVAAADVSPEPVASQPAAPAAAAAPDGAPADPITLNDEAAVCTIEVWHGYVKSRFYARVCTPDGDTYTVAESPTFRRRGDIPEPLPDAVSAHEALLHRLRAEGWRPVGSLGAWYAICLQPMVPSVVSIPR